MLWAGRFADGGGWKEGGWMETSGAGAAAGTWTEGVTFVELENCMPP